MRKAARHLENEIDLKLVAISKVGSSPGGHQSGSDTAPLLGEHVFDTLAVEIEQMLDKLSTINEKMSELRVSGTASTHTLQRHRDILHVNNNESAACKQLYMIIILSFQGYQQEFNKIQANHSTRLEREELLRGSGMMNSSHGPTLNRRDIYMKESGHLHNSHNLLDDQINIAIETREHLNSQRQYLKRVQTRFNDMTNRFPLINR